MFTSNMHLEDLILEVGMENINNINVGCFKTTRSKLKQRLITVADEEKMKFIRL